MKRLIIGLLVLSLLLLAGLCLTTLFTQRLTPVSRQLWHCARLALAQDTAGAVQAARQAENDWQRGQHFFAAFSDHASLDEINSLFAQLPLATRADLPGLYARLASLTQDLMRSQQLRWWTFF